MKKYIIIGLLIIIAGGGYAWYEHDISTTYVRFWPQGVDTKRAFLLSFPQLHSFSNNLQLVLQDKGIQYQVDSFGVVSIPLKVADNKALVTELTLKAEDISWVYAHTKNDHTFLCKGKNYTAVVFRDDTTRLTCEDVQLTEQLLLTDTTFKWSDYCRQYFGYINEKGERCVELVLSSKYDSDIHRLLHGKIVVADGGNSYLNVHINLSRKVVENITPNSVA